MYYEPKNMFLAIFCTFLLPATLISADIFKNIKALFERNPGVTLQQVVDEIGKLKDPNVTSKDTSLLSFILKQVVFKCNGQIDEETSVHYQTSLIKGLLNHGKLKINLLSGTKHPRSYLTLFLEALNERESEHFKTNMRPLVSKFLSHGADPLVDKDDTIDKLTKPRYPCLDASLILTTSEWEELLNAALFHHGDEDENVIKNYTYLLKLAIDADAPEKVTLLVTKYKQDPNTTFTDNNNTPLRYALGKGNPNSFKIVEALVNNGADVTLKDSNSKGLLDYWLECSHKQGDDLINGVKLLLEKGADPLPSALALQNNELGIDFAPQGRYANVAEVIRKAALAKLEKESDNATVRQQKAFLERQREVTKPHIENPSAPDGSFLSRNKWPLAITMTLSAVIMVSLLFQNSRKYPETEIPATKPAIDE